jgi:hypothetical protein
LTEPLSYPERKRIDSEFEKIKQLTQTDIAEFSKFLKHIPIEPYLIPLVRNGKDPDVPKGESWKDPKYKLTVEQAQERLAHGFNVGVVATGKDLVLFDHDAPEKYTFPKETLTVKTRSGKLHKYFLNDGSVKNADGKGQYAKCGEVRAEWKYVVAPGSYVPSDNESGDGVYRVIVEKELSPLCSEELPKEFQPSIVNNSTTQITAVNMAGSFRNQYGWSLEDLRVRDEKLDELLKNSDSGYPSASEADMATLSKLLYWGYMESEAVNILQFFRDREKLKRKDYLEMTLSKIGKTDTIADHVNVKLWKPTQQPLLEKAGERGLIKETKTKHKESVTQETEEEKSLTHVNMIEAPDLAGKPVAVEAMVSSTSTAYLVPSILEAVVIDKEGNEDNCTIEIGERNPDNLKFVGINEDVKFRRLRRLVTESGKVRLEEKAWRTIYRLRVRPPVFTLEKRGDTIFDEKGFEYKAYDIFVAASEPMVFQPSSLVRLNGIVLPNPRNQSITLLVYRVEFPEEVHVFNLKNLDRLKEKFNGCNVQERKDWILGNFAKYSQVVERNNLAYAGLLAFFTPLYVTLNNETQKGWGNITFLGDTTTAKSETMRKLILLLRFGTLITAETASAVGLVGTAIQLDEGGWCVDWGFLVLMDQRLLAVDGAHKLSFAQWAALSEAERSGVVTIAKAAKNTAYARTRQIKIANAVDRESDKFSTRSLGSFVYSAQALATVFDKTGIARLDLVVFADQRDVNASEVNKLLASDYDEDVLLLGDVLRWCWSNTAEVQFTDDAQNELLNEATNLYEKFFAESVPLVSIDMKWKLARLSSSLAFLTLSTDDYRTVTVTKEHIEEIARFITEEYSKAGLNTLAQEDKFETLTTDDAEALITLIISKCENSLEREQVEDILKFIVLRGRVTRDQLMTQFGLAEKNQLRPLLATLSSEKMLRSGRGLYPTSKAVQCYKILISSKLPRLPSLPNMEKTPLKNMTEKPAQKSGPFSPDLGNHGNLGKGLCAHCHGPLGVLFARDDENKPICTMCERVMLKTREGATEQ